MILQIIFLIVWVILGIAGHWRMYHGMLKRWYIRFNESYWDYDKRNGDSAIRFITYTSPLSPLFGLIWFIISFMEEDNCWWFTTKGKIQ